MLAVKEGRHERRMGGQIGRERPCAAIGAGQGQMRQKAAIIGRYADLRKQLVDFAVHRRDGSGRRDASPERVRATGFFKLTNAAETEIQRRSVQMAQYGGNVFGLVVVHLSDEAEGDVELVVHLPAQARDALHHGQENRPNRWRRAQGDEQAMARHGVMMTCHGPIG